MLSHKLMIMALVLIGARLDFDRSGVPFVYKIPAIVARAWPSRVRARAKVSVYLLIHFYFVNELWECLIEYV